MACFSGAAKFSVLSVEGNYRVDHVDHAVGCLDIEGRHLGTVYRERTGADRQLDRLTIGIQGRDIGAVQGKGGGRIDRTSDDMLEQDLRQVGICQQVSGGDTQVVEQCGEGRIGRGKHRKVTRGIVQNTVESRGLQRQDQG